jgi:glucosamine--fructose-6-phosphate aminotransferase (isomerizing)
MAGQYSLAEILSQPECWKRCLEEVQRSGVLGEIKSDFSSDVEWIFVGCGSSFYIAMCAAATMGTLRAGCRARAVPASELLLYPQLTLGPGEDTVVVLISRSGQTSEVLQAAEMLRARGIKTLAISCAPGQPLEKLTTTAIVLPEADEKSTVMTRSFTSMLISLQGVAAALADDFTLFDSADELCDGGQRVLDSLSANIADFVNDRNFSYYVYMGQGPFYGLACEGALKVTEMSVSYAQPFHTLEFRHGPKSIVAKDTLLVFFLSESGYDIERNVLEEMKLLGATTIAVGNVADARVRSAADLVVETNIAFPEHYRLAPSLFAAQFLGLHTGLKKGYDPDTPRNLSRVVLLDSRSSQSTENAAL